MEPGSERMVCIEPSLFECCRLMFHEGTFDGSGKTKLAETILTGDLFVLSDEEKHRFLEQPTLIAAYVPQIFDCE